jgi:hypothetical protein
VRRGKKVALKRLKESAKKWLKENCLRNLSPKLFSPLPPSSSRSTHFPFSIFFVIIVYVKDSLIEQQQQQRRTWWEPTTLMRHEREGAKTFQIFNIENFSYTIG